MGKEEIKQIVAFRFAGTIYEKREDAERALAHLDLYEFIQSKLGKLDEDDDHAAVISNWLERHRDKIIALLQRTY